MKNLLVLLSALGLAVCLFVLFARASRLRTENAALRLELTDALEARDYAEARLWAGQHQTCEHAELRKDFCGGQ